MRRPFSAHYAIVVVDVERYGDPARTSLDQLAVQGALRKALRKAFRKCGIPVDDRLWGDRGDGALILVPSQISKTYLVTSLPQALAAEAALHNARCAALQRMRLRLALHAGEVLHDARGVAGPAVILASRLVDAPPLRAALEASPGVLALIVSDWLFSEVIRHDPAARPGCYRKVEVSVKETTAPAWILAPGPDADPAVPCRGGGLLCQDAPGLLRRPAGTEDVTGTLEPGLAGAAGPSGAPRRIIPAQLPHDVPGFTGREPELRRLESLAGDRASPAVVISAIDGTAGIGKTALAVHFAHRIAGAFPDGQLFASLRGFDPDQPPLEPAEVLAGFLRALGAGPAQVPASLEELAAMYRSLLSGRRVLIVLDNAKDSRQVRPLLPGTASCLTLVTSRRKLNGLTTSDGAQRLSLDVLPPDEAVTLIAQIAGHQRVTADRDAAGRLTQLCGRLPLALRITADRAASHQHLSMSDLAQELTLEHDRLDVLTAEEEEKTTQVRAVFSWSYRALPPGAASAFRLLGLHPGPHISTAAASALTGLPVPVTRELLRTLTSGHLLEETGRDQYQFHDLIRVYAAECAQDDEPEPDRAAALSRLLAWYLHAADAFFQVFNPDHRRVPLGPPPPSCHPETFTGHRQALDWARAELANLIPAVRRAAAVQGDPVAWQLPVVLLPVFSILRCAGDLLPELNRALATARELTDRTAEAWILHCLAEAYLEADRPAQAAQTCQRAAALSARNDDPYGQWTARYLEGISCLRLGRHNDALNSIQQALEAARQCSNPRAEGLSLTCLGDVYRHLGPPETAIELYQRALAILSQTHSKWQQAYAIQRLASAYRDQGHIGDAVDHYHHAQAVIREVGDHWAEANILLELGHAHKAGGQDKAARQAWQQALSILEEFSDARADRVRTQLRKVSA